MECRQFLDMLHPWVDGELDLVHALEMERHLDGCGTCLAEYAALRDLKSRLPQSLKASPAPAGLADKVRAALLASSASPVPQALPTSPARPSGLRPAGQAWPQPGRKARGWMAAATVMAAACIALLVGLWIRNAHERNGSLAAEMVACHVRSLQADHLFDVASSDRHTVKPWFAGKLDFSPPVEDFSGDGFPLVGGRLEYLGRHAVAALVYRRHLHTINVFCWPAAMGEKDGNGNDNEDAGEPQRGYRTAFWSREGFRFGAVSDVNAEEFRQFVRLMRKDP